MPSLVFPGSGAGHHYSKTLTSLPVQPGSVILKVQGGSTIATDNGSGALVGSGISSSSITYSSGVTAWTDSADRTSVNLELDWTVSAPLPVSRLTATPATGLRNYPLAIGTPGNPNPFGVDIKCFDDLDPYFSLIGGIGVLVQDLYHRVTCAPGSVPGAPNFGFDVRLLLSQAMTNQELASIQSNMVAQLMDDERVQSASVQATYSNGTLSVTANGVALNPQIGAQPFQFVAALSSIGAQLLSFSSGPG